MDYAVVPTALQEKILSECKLYKRRWLVLVLFVLYSMSNAMQWIQYSIIANVVIKYYGVASSWVDWTSMVYMIFYVVLIVPGSWALDRFGLRKCVLIGAFGTCLGAWVKVGSGDPSRWWLAFTGQAIVAASQVFVLSVPARLAAVWFGPEQVSSACSIGVFGNQLGIAVGFLLPPMMVKNSDSNDELGKDFRFMYYFFAALTSVIFIFIVVLFKDGPPKPPSQAQAMLQQQAISGETPDFKSSIMRLLTNTGYLLLLVSYGINVGVFYAISTLLNQIILDYFPGAEEDAGMIGLTIVIAGMAGSVLCGVVLDKTHKFKETTLVVYVFSLVGMVIYTFTLGCGKIGVVYLTAGILGFFQTGYLPVGFELGAELTFPEPEGTSAGLLNGVVQIFGIVFTNAYSACFSAIGGLYSNLVLCGALAVGVVVTALIKSDLRRQKAQGGGALSQAPTVAVIPKV